MPWQGGYNLFMANRLDAAADGRYLTQDEPADGAGAAGAAGAAESANPTRALALAGWRRAVDSGAWPPPADPARPFRDADAYWFARARRAALDSPAATAGLFARKLLYLVSDKEVFNYEDYDLQRRLSPVLRWGAPGRFGLWWPLALASLAAWPLGRRTAGRAAAWQAMGLYGAALAPAVALYYASGRMRMPLAFPAVVLGAAGLGAWLAPAGCRPRPAAYLALLALGAAMSWGDWWGVRSESMAHADLARMSNAAWLDRRPRAGAGLGRRGRGAAPRLSAPGGAPRPGALRPGPPRGGRRRLPRGRPPPARRPPGADQPGRGAGLRPGAPRRGRGRPRRGAAPPARLPPRPGSPGRAEGGGGGRPPLRPDEMIPQSLGMCCGSRVSWHGHPARG